MGESDCVRRAAYAIRQRGHRVSLAKLGTYSTLAGAVRAMKKQGYGSLIEALDGQGFARIAPARRWPGDVVALPSDDAFGCSLAVALSDGNVLSSINEVCMVVRPLQMLAAWRV